jgi:hypothetical protein
MFAPILSCAKFMTCTTCAGMAAKVACLDGGGIQITGCETACERLSSSCTDSGSASDGGKPVDGASPVDGTPVDGTPVDGTPVDGTPAGEGGPTACLGAPIVAQTDSSNTSETPQLVPFSAAGVAIFGPSNGNGGFGEPGGFFDLSGTLGDTDVNVQIVMAPCSTTNCPTDITFGFGTTDSGTVSVGSTPGSCGSTVVHTNAGGHLLVSVGKTGDAGAENGIGIVLKPVVTDAGTDASGD